MTQTSRRNFLTGCGLALAGSAAALPAAAAATGFRYCLNTATLQGYKLDLVPTLEIAAKAGYQSVEPWLSAIDAYVKSGGSLSDLRKRIADWGLTVESAIAFPQWIVDDPAKRASGLEQVRRDMDTVAQIGGKRIAAPPAGATTGAEIGLAQIAERYRAVLEVGDRMGVVAELEIWGGSVNLHRLDQAVFVAMQTGHPKACVLPDIFHLYKGGSGFEGLRMLSGEAVQVLHMNDYPANPPRETIADRDRVYPGDGTAPMKQILAEMKRMNPAMVLSLELFNPAYWKGDPLETAKTGLAKMNRYSS
ncbi:MAG TPA: sugar phosphate isomerase/epimerase family protein [Candidatus Sulfopaludibacter sp.]|jgi:sugar phosphate isomerase/epimerase|nr:sugar phosphate isomerase/epimerase family protein [Candidatus Sulfopaludibacter sp.]